MQILIILILQILILALFARQYYYQEKRRKAILSETLTDNYVDYVCVQRMLMIRVFPKGYDTEAMEGINAHQILEFGLIGSQQYYLIQLI